MGNMSFVELLFLVIIIFFFIKIGKKIISKAKYREDVQHKPSPVSKPNYSQYSLQQLEALLMNKESEYKTESENVAKYRSPDLEALYKSERIHKEILDIERAIKERKHLK